MASGLKSLLGGAKRLALGAGADRPAGADALFPRVDPAVDGEACLRDCEDCTVHYPRGFKVDESDELYGHVKGWSTHLLVATGKSDWVRDVEDEEGSVMQAIGKAEKPKNGKLMLSASNIPTPHHTSDYSEPTTVLLLPAFTIVENVTPASVPALLRSFVDAAPTTTSPLAPPPAPLPRSLAPAPAPGGPEAAAGAPALASRPCPHAVLVLLCSQRTRDARCGQSAPLLRRELERHLRPLGLHRGPDDERPGGVGVYFISHVGGHKYSANVMVYRRPDAFGLDAAAAGGPAEAAGRAPPAPVARTAEELARDDYGGAGAAQCIWLARVRPEDVEGLVRYTILQGKVVKPERQLRGGFDRAKGLMSW